MVGGGRGAFSSLRSLISRSLLLHPSFRCLAPPSLTHYLTTCARMYNAAMDRKTLTVEDSKMPAYDVFVAECWDGLVGGWLSLGTFEDGNEASEYIEYARESSALQGCAPTQYRIIASRTFEIL